MKKSPRLAARVMVVALALAATAVNVSARPSDGQGPACSPGAGAMRGAGMGGQPDRVAARITELQTALKLQTNQQSAFDAFAAKLTAEAQARAGFHASMQQLAGNREAMADFRVSMAQHRATAMAEINQLRKNLVAVLTPEQLKVLDGFGPQGGGQHAGGGRMMGGHHMGGHMMGGRMGGQMGGPGCAAQGS